MESGREEDEFAKALFLLEGRTETLYTFRLLRKIHKVIVLETFVSNLKRTEI